MLDSGRYVAWETASGEWFMLDYDESEVRCIAPPWIGDPWGEHSWSSPLLEEVKPMLRGPRDLRKLAASKVALIVISVVNLAPAILVREHDLRADFDDYLEDGYGLNTKDGAQSLTRQLASLVDLADVSLATDAESIPAELPLAHPFYFVTDKRDALCWLEYGWALRRGLRIRRCDYPGCGRLMYAAHNRSAKCAAHTAPPDTPEAERLTYERWRQRRAKEGRDGRWGGFSQRIDGRMRTAQEQDGL